MSSRDKIVEIVKEELMIEEFDMDADLTKDYELDSIALLDMVMNIEEEFEIEISEKELSQIKSVNDVISVVDSKIGK